MPIDPAKLDGLSEKLVVSHHQNNYAGAVKRLNAIRAELAALKFATAPGFQINGLKREELIATNSMLLHELHFSCLGGDGKTMPPAMALALDASFGSVDRWKEEFVAMGKALGGGSGWVLYLNPFSFDIRRNPNPHLAFGYGTHSCFGDHLGRLELRVVLEALLDRVERIELTGQPTWAGSNKHTVVLRMPVKLTGT